MNCKEIRSRLEERPPLSNAPLGAELDRHLGGCAACAEFVQLQRWSGQVLAAARIDAEPPLMSAVWASIHRASEQAWDSALTRSFRYLLPYMVAVVAIILLVGGLRPTSTAQAASAAVAATSPFAVMSAPETPKVYSLLTSDSTQDPADLIGVAATSH